MKTALIFGITGQDGFYLSNLLLNWSYDKVVGVKRRSSTNNLGRLRNIEGHHALEIVEGDVADPFSVGRLISEYKPTECYNLAAQSHVWTSFQQPVYTTDVDYVGPLNILESIRVFSPNTKFYQASTSEMFGKSYTEHFDKWLGGANVHGLFLQQPVTTRKFQNESTPMLPQSPYGIAKLAAHHAVRLYRQSYGLFACSGILFNHESELRGEQFVTRKITKYVAELEDALASGATTYERLQLGNIWSVRDWGHAEDYVRGMHKMLQAQKPQDYVLATGKTHTVRDFLEAAFKEIGQEWERWVVLDKKHERPSEVDYLCGDASKAKRELGWEPTVSFEQLVKRMVEHDRLELRCHEKLS